MATTNDGTIVTCCFIDQATKVGCKRSATQYIEFPNKPDYTYEDYTYACEEHAPELIDTDGGGVSRPC